MMKFLPFVLLLSILFPLVAQAGFIDVLVGVIQDIICILTGFICPDPCLKLGYAASKLCHLVDRVGEALYIIGWSLALVVLLWGGISYMVSAGDEGKIKKAKQIIKSGLIGAAIVLCAGFILSILVEFLSPLFY